MDTDQVTSKVFFISDTHFGHERMVDQNRPFVDIGKMDKQLIDNWNKVIGEDDTVWHLGDFSAYRDGRLENLFWRLNGKKYLVVGNHDEENEAILELPWEETPVLHKDIWVGKDNFFLCHYPMRSWKNVVKGAINLHGHTHGFLNNTRQSMDVGGDACQFHPVGIEDIHRILRKSNKHPEGLPIKDKKVS